MQACRSPGGYGTFRSVRDGGPAFRKFSLRYVLKMPPDEKGRRDAALRRGYRNAGTRRGVAAVRRVLHSGTRARKPWRSGGELLPGGEVSRKILEAEPFGVRPVPTPPSGIAGTHVPGDPRERFRGGRSVRGPAVPPGGGSGNRSGRSGPAGRKGSRPGHSGGSRAGIHTPAAAQREAPVRGAGPQGGRTPETWRSGPVRRPR